VTDHRRLQRTLFRMQHDPGFALRLRSGDADAAASTGLQRDDLDLLLATQPAAVEADAGGKRRAQFLRNVSSEHALTVAAAAAAGLPSLVEDFTASEEFHRAIREDRSLPEAFAAHALRSTRGADPFVHAMARLEGALCAARRDGFPRPAPHAGQWMLSPRAEVLELPEGAVDAAGRLRQALDAGQPPPVPCLGGGREHALVIGGPRPAHSLAEVGVEVLSPLAGRVLELAREGLGPARLAAFCEEHDVEEGEFAPFLASLVADGVVRRGTGEPK
jgi:hypothetical protein